MADLSDEPQQGVSLSPVVGVLACVLGAMAFVFTSAATVSSGAEADVDFVVNDSGPDVTGAPKPTWLEWDGHEMVVRPSGDAVTFDEDLSSIATFQATYDYMFERLSSSRVGSELAALATDPSRYAVLLVRPSGFASLAEVRGYLDRLGVRHVAEPIDERVRGVGSR